MFIDLFYKLRHGGIPATITEYLHLLEALDKGVVNIDINEFYYLTKTSLIKDERFFDRFDQIFSEHFNGIENIFEELFTQLPEEWLRRQKELHLSDAEKAQIEALGGWDKIMEALKERLKEQKERHQGGNKMIGTAGRSAFGAYGYNPEGIRIGQDESRHKRAIKVWDKREFKNLDDNVELGTRNIKLALRHLRKFARQGASDELDLHDTIHSTARNGGYLDIKMAPERHNAVKLLLFFDVGGSMNPYVQLCEELFSAAKTEFKHLEYFYFHNCVYEEVWKDNKRRHTDKTPVMEIIHKYSSEHKLLFIGDASMSPYEIMMAGGSVEHMNSEPGATWLMRLVNHYHYAAWINPLEKQYWDYTASIKTIEEIMQQRMYTLTIQGLNEAIEGLKKQPYK